MLETILNSDDTEERCGFLLKDGTIIEIRNAADDPVAGYEMDPVEALPHIKGGEVAATWHTHPHSDPNLSGEDYQGFQQWPDLEHYIIGYRDGAVVVTHYKIEDGLVIACN